MIGKRLLFFLVFAIISVSPVITYGGQETRAKLIDAVTKALEMTNGEAIKAELVEDHYEVWIKTRTGSVEKVYIDAGVIVPEVKEAITLVEAKSIALKNTPGEILAVELKKGRYQVKIKTDSGSTVRIYIDEKTGEIVKRKERKPYIYDERFDSWSD